MIDRSLQIEALKLSIKKWEGIVEGIRSDNSPEDCECCIKFHSDDCFGCPIREYTLKFGCRGTPYDRFDTYMEISGHRKVFDKKSKELAQAELDFLKTVLEDLKSWVF